MDKQLRHCADTGTAQQQMRGKAETQGTHRQIFATASRQHVILFSAEISNLNQSLTWVVNVSYLPFSQE